MEQQNGRILEGVFAINKPTAVSSAEVLQKLQTSLATSQTFAPLLKHQPSRPSKDESQAFRMGHGGTLDPLAAGVLIVGIGRGTKQLQQYLACSKTYETVVLFGASTDTYDCTGAIQEQSSARHVSKALVEEKLTQFLGTIQQQPPIYSALKLDGIKACEYARQGKDLPRKLESREMQVDECRLLDWHEPGQHDFAWPGGETPAQAPAARIKLTVCSGFYVRSFAHDLGISCGTNSHMAALVRTRQANFTINDPSEQPECVPAITYADLDAGEIIWAAKLRPQLEKWVDMNPIADRHANGRDQQTKRTLAAAKESRPRQRFRGGWVAETKQERIKQQGGKYKGKWNQKRFANMMSPSMPQAAD